MFLAVIICRQLGMGKIFDSYKFGHIQNNFFSCTSFSPDFFRNHYVEIHKILQVGPLAPAFSIAYSSATIGFAYSSATTGSLQI